MHVGPVNTMERFFALLVVWFALVVFSTFVSRLTSTMSQLQDYYRADAKYVWQLRRWLKSHSVEKKLAQRVQRHVEHVLRDRKKHTSRAEIPALQHISHSLHAELSVDIYKRSLVAHALFDMTESNFSSVFRQICGQAISESSWAIGDTIFHPQVRSNYSMVVTHRTIYYQRFGDPIERPVDIGTWISEPAMWTIWLHVGNLQCHEFCTTFQVDPEKVSAAALQIPEAWRKTTNFFVVRVSSQ
eukprot:TRINITY_DN46737_c0_g1_i1.p1 TRINITY_DN46737_c0_g1~~TRINITY_DN46737_c0_g1_i1.p1  ORF type:complete len:243 (-),score=21.35 TRINITY_DN46737_c0_g1_i1:398-1126(-)